MKALLKYQIWMWIMLSVGICSCDRMNDLHDEYLQRGEKTYLSKIDSIEILPGNQRAKIRFTNMDPKAKSIAVFWRSRTDSLIFSLPEQHVGKELEIDLLDLPEDYLTFEVVSRSADGMSKSLIKELSTRIYGAQYQTSLNSRVVKSATYNKSTFLLNVNWGGALDNAVNVEISYQGIDDKERREVLPIEDLSMLYLNLFKDGLQYRTAYVPVENSLDTFYSNPVDLAYSNEKIISGLNFNGLNQYLRITNHNDFNILEGESLSISFWAKTSVGTAVQRLINKRYSAGDTDNGHTGYGIALLGGAPNSFKAYPNWNYKAGASGGGATDIIPTATYKPDEWFHVTVVFEVGNFTLYLNGVQIGKNSFNIAKSTVSSSDVYVGTWLSAPTAALQGFFKGEMADLRFWKKALTVNDIAIDMKTDVQANTLGLVAAYDLSKVQTIGSNLVIPDIKGKHPAVVYGHIKP
ncbi:DUF4998 domain-containing protein [Sphingobacterium sp. SYP-B4668]|uniref:DUF4998 domain-containing protein n=1 Tax=Sphingobacterium sp. SYP-B4668 TaxID=2996035 RepID=UPI0022DE6B9F|nr:DUF4998 domain-containing protein [Sphingobacterium sp. SYP-B4668]